MRTRLRYLYESPSFNKQLSNFARFGNLLLVLPMVLTSLDIAELQFWLLLGGFGQLVVLFEGGFLQNLVAPIAIAFAGGTQADVEENLDTAASKEKGDDRPPNLELLRSLDGTTSRIYTVIAIVFIVVYNATIWVVLGPLVSGLPKPELGVAALIASGSLQPFAFLTSRSVSILQGCQKLAQVERLGVVCHVAALLGTLGVAVLAPRLDLLVVVPLLGTFSGAVLTYRLLLEERKAIGFANSGPFSKDLFAVVWARVWRTTVALALGVLITQISVAYASSRLDPGPGAALALAQRVAQILYEFSASLFWVILPRLVYLRIRGEHASFHKLASQRLLLATVALAFGGICYSIAGPLVLRLMRKDEAMIEPLYWAVLMTGTLLQVNAMLALRVLQTNNRVFIHKAAACGLVGFVPALFLLPETSDGLSILVAVVISQFLSFGYVFYRFRVSPYCRGGGYLKRQISVIAVVLLLLTALVHLDWSLLGFMERLGWDFRGD